MIPFGQARICREGSHVTVVAISLMVHRALEAAARLEQQGISVEIIDPRTPVPLDKEAIYRSVAKTGRLVIVDEGPAACSFASEISAMVTEEIFDALDAPILRVCALPVPHPFNPTLEAEMLPSTDKIVDAVARLLKN
jgi:pyruvate dehydrogenase E1 component beta subunit